MLAYSPLSASSAWQSDSRSSTRRSPPPLPNSRLRNEPVLIRLLLRRGGRLGLVHQALGFLAGDALEVVAVLEEHAERVVHRLRIERDAVERHQAVRPVDGLGHARQLEQLGLAQALDEGHHLLRQRGGGLRRFAVQDLELALRVRIVDPVVEAAPLHRVVDLAGAVRGDDDDRRLLRLQRAELGNRDLPVREHLEQIGLERLVGAVELVDQQHRRITFERARQWALDEKFVGVNLRAQLLLVLFAGRLGQPALDHLPRVVPLVGRLGNVQALVALQANELAAERLRHHLADFGLADAGLALQEQRAAHGERKEKGGGEAAIGHVLARREQRLGLVDRLWKGLGHGEAAERAAFSGFSLPTASREPPLVAKPERANNRRRP